MVWGMALPGGFGDFFPGGEYVGWKEELTSYYNNEMPADQRSQFGDPPSASSYIYWVSECLKSEPGPRLNSAEFPPCRPIMAHEAPKRFQTRKNYTSLGSLVKLTNRILAVDGDLKGLIETFEPGRHRFFPLEIVMTRKVIYPKPYFVLDIGQYIDSFLPDQSDSGSWRHTDNREYYVYEDRKPFMSKLALSKQKFDGAHLWRERKMVTHLICFSDALMADIDRAGLRLPKHCRLNEV